MKKLSFVVALLFSAAVMAQNVEYSFDQNVDFKQYRTYHWEQHPGSTELDPLTKSQLAEAFNVELAKKGLIPADSDSADLVLVYQIAVRNEKEITFFDTGWGYGPGWRRGWYGPRGGSTISTTTSTIQIGSLVLDMYDAQKKHLVWRAVASKAIDEGVKPDKRKKNMAKAAQKLLKNFPPRKK
jgi:hypothetical protein